MVASWTTTQSVVRNRESSTLSLYSPSTPPSLSSSVRKLKWPIYQDSAQPSRNSNRGHTNLLDSLSDDTHNNNDDINFGYTEPSLSGNSPSRRRWLNTVANSVVASFAGSACGMLSSPRTGLASSGLVTTRAVCDPAVSVWKKNGRIVYLLGTAHISSNSAALAGQLVRDTAPSGVFVELDPKRVSGSGVLAQKVGGDTYEGSPATQSRIIVPHIQIIDGPPPIPPEGLLATLGRRDGDVSPDERAARVLTAPPLPASPPPTVKPPRTSPLMQAASVAVGNSIKSMYKNLDSAGFEPGEEFATAIREGRKLGSDIVLGDRDVEVTLRRLTEGLVRTDLTALLNPDSELEKSLQELVPSSLQKKMLPGGGSNAMGDLSKEEFREEFSTFVEIMKSKENVQKIMGELQRVAPFLYDALVGERDAYMAAGLNGLNELETIVAVVGIAHVYGIEANLQSNGWTRVNLMCSRYR